ncbi:hypothetical protein OIU84_024741 [Salix udensis]|uniref:Uncharacterized protein n=1 Tax=Salix udensis TaxID=889485 RepID=A0AAD6KHZ3_9ROSI|nr:hypothetical protein OIU84_024741 [Salix udensis]
MVAAETYDTVMKNSHLSRRISEPLCFCVICLIYAIVLIIYADKSKKNLAIKTKSVEYMPFYLSLSTLLTTLSFCTFGMLRFDPFLYESTFLQTFGIVVEYNDRTLYCTSAGSIED